MSPKHQVKRLVRFGGSEVGGEAAASVCRCQGDFQVEGGPSPNGGEGGEEGASWLPTPTFQDTSNTRRVSMTKERSQSNVGIRSRTRGQGWSGQSSGPPSEGLRSSNVTTTSR